MCHVVGSLCDGLWTTILMGVSLSVWVSWLAVLEIPTASSSE